MPRTTVPKSVAPGNYAGASAVVTMTAADVVNKNQFVAQGNDLVIARNSGIAVRTITVTSAPDPFGRTRDITAEAIAAGAVRVFGPLPIPGWMQSDGKIYLEADNAEVLFGIVQLPG